MKIHWPLPVKILTGICTAAVCSFAQSYTISAKPGAVNFIEGSVTLNGEPVWTSNLKSTFLQAGDVLAVEKGKIEVLLTPGVFLRVGSDSQVRMVTPSLVNTRIEMLSGESMVEVDDIVPGSSVTVLDHGAATTPLKPGLYRFSDSEISTLDGRAQVLMGDRRIELKKNKQVQIDSELKVAKVDLSQSDDLYAWSNIRSQYAAAATYQGARDVYNSGGYGFSSFNSPGWYWSSPFNSYMWLPGNGAFYSPFGWGFYGPGVVAYAPVFAYPFGGYGYGGIWRRPFPGAGGPGRIIVPVSPNHPGVTPGAAGFQGTSPAALAAARSQMQQAVGAQGLRTANGAPAAALHNGQTFANARQASQAAMSNAQSRSAAPTGGGFTGGARSGGAMPSARPSGGGGIGGGGHSSK